MMKGCLRLVINDLSLNSKMSWIFLNFILIALFNKRHFCHVMAENSTVWVFNAYFSDLGSP